MLINASTIPTTAVGFLLGLAVKTLLEFRVATFLVKWLWWLPVRNIFREKPIKLAGQWEQTWSSGTSPKFQDARDRHAHPVVRQLGSHCYSEFLAKGAVYVLFGRVEGQHLVGEWYDKKDRHGYFGVFQLRISDSATMEGKWVGHSKTSYEIRCDDWYWKRVSA